ncbi:hypothetical protein CASFOL_016438 [Castilleja foliolosa]|uniref:Cystatin domain-containing protein n=1 Tax=Castilleja foliolosa TaxID=1961234 RepID=A0ABD3DKS0_9LAMI
METLKSLPFPFVILTISLALYSFQAFASAPGPGPALAPLGDYKVPEPINPNDPTVIKMANFAVSEQNRKPGAIKLELVRVVKADIVVFGGLNYRLVITATEAGVKSPANYVAVVLESNNEPLKLVYFKRDIHG